MSSEIAGSSVPTPPRHYTETLRVAFVGPGVWLDGCAPPEAAGGLVPALFPTGAELVDEETHAAIERFRPHATVVLDPPSLAPDALPRLPGATLGVLVGGLPAEGSAGALESLDRLISFRPALTGETLGAAELWRAIPPPVSDALFAPVRPLHGVPLVISLGAASAHREEMLISAKHHHDLLQVIHGVSGEPLAELMGECDVGVYVAPESGGGFGLQVGMHLAAGHLLLAEELIPAHGLERNIDYLHFDSPDGLAWMLERLGRFPEMHQRIRVRGRLKAEQYRASRLFARLCHDLLADVAAFGSPRPSGSSMNV